MKVTTKQADSLAVKLQNAMDRNTSLAVGKGTLPSPGPVSTYAPEPVATKLVIPTQRISQQQPGARRSGIRLKNEDDKKIREIIQAGFALQHNLNATDAIRIALQAYDAKRLAAADIVRIRNHRLSRTVTQ